MKQIPNTITCCNLVCGCIATSFALEGNALVALLFIIGGAVFDFFDGMSARLLGVSSPIGKELDSLADVVTFGVAPSSMLFTYFGGTAVGQFSPALPYAAFVMAAFSALRLAKFNLDTRQATSFIGLPTPANALFWGALIVGAGDALAPWSWALLALMLVMSVVLVSEIPMFALKFKTWGWRGNEVKFIFVIGCALLVALFQIVGIAASIAWYVLLSAATTKLKIKN